MELLLWHKLSLTLYCHLNNFSQPPLRSISATNEIGHISVSVGASQTEIKSESARVLCS